MESIHEDIRHISKQMETFTNKDLSERRLNNQLEHWKNSLKSLMGRKDVLKKELLNLASDQEKSRQSGTCSLITTSELELKSNNDNNINLNLINNNFKCDNTTIIDSTVKSKNSLNSEEDYIHDYSENSGNDYLDNGNNDYCFSKIRNRDVPFKRVDVNGDNNEKDDTNNDHIDIHIAHSSRTEAYSGVCSKVNRDDTVNDGNKFKRKDTLITIREEDDRFEHDDKNDNDDDDLYLNKDIGVVNNYEEDGEVVSDNDEDNEVVSDDDDEDYQPILDDNDVNKDDDEEIQIPKKKGNLVKMRRRKNGKKGMKMDGNKGIKMDGKKEKGRLKRDDYDKKEYIKRISNISDDSNDNNDINIDGGLKIPADMWKQLYPHQQSAVKWLWHLHQQKVGGILGDEMGLGKTIELLAFLQALHTSDIRDEDFSSHSSLSYQGLGPVLIIAPSTVMSQWVEEMRKWVGRFRVVVVHGNVSGVHRKPEKVLRELFPTSRSSSHNDPPLIIVSSYNTVVLKKTAFLRPYWHYVVLDEGHKVKNPDAQISHVCKQFSTSHRILLTGSPMQNNLKELWALFDFIYPGKLGTLQDFLVHFNFPILQGGYANSNDFQVQTGYRCAQVLRQTIKPYLLRRMKADMKEHVKLPGKNEQVLFCRLTPQQRDHYQDYLNSQQCKDIFRGKMNAFPGIITLRKICNHTWLIRASHPGDNNNNKNIKNQEKVNNNSDACRNIDNISTINVNHNNNNLNNSNNNNNNSDGSIDIDQGSDEDYLKGGGKLVVVDCLLKMWKKQRHKVLLFSQSSKMLSILQSFVISKGYQFVRMDGTTSIPTRQNIIRKFNQDDDVFIFLLTTRVGGLGINLTGADRVLIYDPDWNPTTDIQARERAWRIGQRRNVTVYRLLTTGTIEEKIYHRQIFKQFLTNRILSNAKQRRFFKLNHLRELFSLADDEHPRTETACMFAGSSVKVKKKTMKIGDDGRGVGGKIEGEEAGDGGVDDGEGFGNSGSIGGIEGSVKNDVNSSCSGDAKDVGCRSDDESGIKVGCDDDESIKVGCDDDKGDGVQDDIRKSDYGNDKVIGDNDKVIRDDDVSDNKNASISFIKTYDLVTVPDISTISANNNISNISINNISNISINNISNISTISNKRTNNSIIIPKSSTNITSSNTNTNITSTNTHTNITPIKTTLTNSLTYTTNTTVNTISTFTHNDGNDNEDDQRRSKMKELAKRISFNIGAKFKAQGNKKEETKHTKRSKLKKDGEVRVDGEIVENVAKMEKFKEKKEKRRKYDIKKDGDDYILSKLFKKTGVHSALKHDKIMSSCYHDHRIVAMEAEKVAKEAVDMLKRSERNRRCAVNNVSTSRYRFGVKKSTEDAVGMDVENNIEEKDRNKNIQNDGKKRRKEMDEGMSEGMNEVINEGIKSNVLSSSNLLTHLKSLRVIRNYDNDYRSNNNYEDSHLEDNDISINSAEDSTSNYNSNYGTCNNNISLESLPIEAFSHLPEQDRLRVKLASDLKAFVSNQTHHTSREHSDLNTENDGWVSSRLIVNHFKHILPPSQSAFFKSLSRQMCRFKLVNGLGFYKLKPNF